MGMLFCCWHVLLPRNMHFRDMCKNHTKQQLKVSRCFKKLTEMRLLLIQMSTFTWAYHHRLKCWGAALRLISHVPQCVTKRRSEKKKKRIRLLLSGNHPPAAHSMPSGGMGAGPEGHWKAQSKGTLRVSVSCWTPESPQNKLLREGGGIEKQLTQYFRRGLDN